MLSHMIRVLSHATKLPFGPKVTRILASVPPLSQSTSSFGVSLPVPKLVVSENEAQPGDASYTVLECAAGLL
jgi:hypothetical protein